MSTETIPYQLDKFSETSAVVGIGKTREEYLKLFSRACISPENDRPYSNPMSGFYDALNTSTSLILLNQRFKYSHLREQILLEELSNSSRKEFDYESIFEVEQPKSKHTKKIRSSSIGQTKYWHDRRCTSSCLTSHSTDISHVESNRIKQSRKAHKKPRRSVSVNRCSSTRIFKQDTSHEEPQPDPSFTESVYQYYQDVIEKSQQSEFNLQQYSIKESCNQRLKTTGIRRKLPLTKGQQLSLLEKYHIYDINDTKVRRSHSYSQTLTDRLKADFNCKPKFRLNDVHDYSKYAKFLQIPRSLSPGSSIRSADNKKQLTNNNIHKSFPTSNNKNPVTILHHQEPKQISTLPIQN
ncbi:unnamed protein product [Rotaria sordida]|uniref:Uncharacterized protein n=1 Tax=Rotaria sordida TaxID=392033 RepID=A0A818R081_9BILA|nr:unnamed protein product [Rotaria sordida]CAF3642391.1 unnamed protein product [Rotaria sordida]